MRASGAPVPAMTETVVGTASRMAVTRSRRSAAPRAAASPVRAGDDHGGDAPLHEPDGVVGRRRHVDLEPLVEQRDQGDGDATEDRPIRLSGASGVIATIRARKRVGGTSAGPS